jgi:phosphohistidine phosphatase
MELILWRHAEAEEGIPDAARELTEKGLDQAERMADWLRSQLPEDVSVIVSPARRTQQTALALRSDFITRDEIGPGASAESMLKVINWPDRQGTVVIVGHQPTLGEVVKKLVPVIPAGLSIRKGSVCWIKDHDVENVLKPILHAVVYPEML